jgi:hypothetical protein
LFYLVTTENSQNYTPSGARAPLTLLHLPGGMEIEIGFLRVLSWVRLGKASSIILGPQFSYCPNRTRKIWVLRVGSGNGDKKSCCSWHPVKLASCVETVIFIPLKRKDESSYKLVWIAAGLYLLFGKGGSQGETPFLTSFLDLKNQEMHFFKRSFFLKTLPPPIPFFLLLLCLPNSHPPVGILGLPKFYTINDFHTICVLPPSVEPASFHFSRRILPSKVCSPPLGELA